MEERVIGFEVRRNRAVDPATRSGRGPDPQRSREIRLNGAIVTALKDPGMLERTRSLGAVPMPFSPAEFAHYIRSEYEKWAAVVAQTGAKEP
jgi:tripartite-type tricarboxylate transporter receptor subunit TctC